jgi:hypothetical protein
LELSKSSLSGLSISPVGVKILQQPFRRRTKFCYQQEAKNFISENENSKIHKIWLKGEDMHEHTKLIFAAIALISFCAAAHAEGLDTLIEVSRSQAQIQKDYDRQTKAFESVKRAIEKGKLKSGESKGSIRSSYGEPVIVLEKGDASPEMWVYKSAASSYFGGEKIYLTFDKKGKLSIISTAYKSGETKG